MKKSKFLLFVCLLSSSACSFIIDNSGNTPDSKHVPSVDSPDPLFSKLRDTIWKKIDNDKKKETYLFFHDQNVQYALVVERFGTPLERYPKDYLYIKLKNTQHLVSSLKPNRAVIFVERHDPNKFVGYYLKDSHTLIVVESTRAEDVVDSLEEQKGTEWDLYQK